MQSSTRVGIERTSKKCEVVYSGVKYCCDEDGVHSYPCSTDTSVAFGVQVVTQGDDHLTNMMNKRFEPQR
jgi:hypothetical protein